MTIAYPSTLKLMLNHFLRLALCAAFLNAIDARASVIFVGTLSYDTFIPGAAGSPGVDALDLANLTGSFGLSPDFPAADDLTFLGATLTLTSSDSSQEVFALGDIEPGFLLDFFGNPIVQVPDSDAFISAEFTATLSSPTFTLADGTTFTANSNMLEVLLLPLTGPTLTPNVDQTVIPVTQRPTAATPEVTSLGLVAPALMGLLWVFNWRRALTKRVGSQG